MWSIFLAAHLYLVSSRLPNLCPLRFSSCEQNAGRELGEAGRLQGATRPAQGCPWVVCDSLLFVSEVRKEFGNLAVPSVASPACVSLRCSEVLVRKAIKQMSYKIPFMLYRAFIGFLEKSCNSHHKYCENVTD